MGEFLKENIIFIEVNIFNSYAEMYARYYSFYPDYNYACHTADDPWCWRKQWTNDSQLAGQLVVWTTILSLITLFMIIFIVRALGLL